MMRASYFILLFFSACFTLSAQSNASLSIYVPDVSGGSFNENLNLTSLIKRELGARNYRVLESAARADFIVSGRINPERQVAGNLFRLELRNARTGRTLVQQNLPYYELDDLYSVFPVMIFMLFNSPQEDDVKEPLPEIPPVQYVEVETPILRIPVEKELSDDWRNKWLYLSGFFIWAPRLYSGVTDSVYIMNFGGGVMAELNFLNFLGLGLGGELTSDWIATSSGNEYVDLILTLPLTVRAFIKPADDFILGAYAGIKFNVPLIAVTNPPLLAWTVGLNGGVKAGPGIVFLDLRYAMDLGTSHHQDGKIEYQRYMLNISAGYKFGFFLRKN